MTDFPLDEPETTREKRAFVDRHARAIRWLLAGPMALILAILLMAALPFALPAGRGGINHLVLPVIFFPLIWATLIILPVATAQLARLAQLYLLLLAACAIVIAVKLLV